MLISSLLYKIYGIKHRRLRWVLRQIITKIEGGEFYSPTLRRIFEDYYDVKIGMYTHGGCFVPGRTGRFTTIGRYSSISVNFRVFRRNHPMEFKSTHALFFNPELEYSDRDLVGYTPLSIGNDVWIGDSAIILPNVTQIGDGAVIGAGAVVNKNVPPYAIVVGSPARVVRYRFSREVIDELIESRWWEKSIEEIKPNIGEYQQPYEKLRNEGLKKIRGKPQ